MILKTRTSADVPSSEITSEHAYRSRREFLKTAGRGAAGVAAGVWISGAGNAVEARQASLLATLAPLSSRNSSFRVDEAVDPINTYDQITQYNNYYEFTKNKQGVWRIAGSLTTKPWTVKVDGLVKKPGDYGVEDLVNFNQLEERVYRHRCVEAWSAVIPWIGVPLADVLKKVEPLPGRSSWNSRPCFVRVRCRAWRRAA